MEKKKILLVEDNPDDIELTKMSLQKTGCMDRSELDVANDGKEAIDRLGDSNVVSYDLILLDLDIPKKNGFDVLEYIKKNDGFKSTSIVVLTSSEENKDIVKAYRLGADSYICKPVNFDDFSNVIKEIAIYWLELNKPHPKIYGC